MRLRNPFVLVATIVFAAALPSYPSGQETLETSEVRFSFQTSATSVQLESIERLDTGHTFDLDMTQSLWAIQTVIDDTGQRQTVAAEPDSAPVTVFTNLLPDELVFLWKKFEVAPGQKWDVWVRVKRTSADAETLLWDIQVIPKTGTTWFVEEIHFPILRVEEVPNDVATLPALVGLITHEPTKIAKANGKAMTLIAPGREPATMSTQFFSYYDDAAKELLYMATRDEVGYRRRVRVLGEEGQGAQPGSVTYTFVSYPSIGTDPSAPAASFKLSDQYDLELGAIGGDWYDATQRYKSWALASTLVDAGKIADKSPQSFRDAMLHITTSTCAPPGPACDPPAYVDAIRDWKSFIGVDPVDPAHTAIVRLEMYDRFDPEWWPNRQVNDHSLYGAVQSAGAYGGVIMPWWNVNFWWQLSPIYPPEIQQYAGRKLDGSLILKSTVENSARDYVVPNLSMKAVRDLHIEKSINPDINGILGENKLATCSGFESAQHPDLCDPCDGFGFGGIYIDTLTGRGGEVYTDFNPAFQAATGGFGGGSYIAEGVRDLGTEIKDAMLSCFGEPVFLSSEYPNELYADQFELAHWQAVPLELWKTDTFFLLPIYQTVYQQYQWLTNFQSIVAVTEPVVPLLPLNYYEIARHMDAGSLPNVNAGSGQPFVPGGPGNVQPEADELFGYYRDLIAEQIEFKDWIRFGERLEPPVVDVETLTIDELRALAGDAPRKLIRPYYTGHPAGMAYVFTSAWMSEAGELLVMMINWDENPRTFSMSLDFSEYGFALGDVALVVDGVSSFRGTFSVFTETDATIAGRNARYYVVTPQ